MKRYVYTCKVYGKFKNVCFKYQCLYNCADIHVTFTCRKIHGFFFSVFTTIRTRHSDVTYNHENELDHKPMEGCFDFGITKSFGAWNNVSFIIIFKIILAI